MPCRLGNTRVLNRLQSRFSILGFFCEEQVPKTGRLCLLLQRNDPWINGPLSKWLRLHTLIGAYDFGLNGLDVFPDKAANCGCQRLNPRRWLKFHPAIVS